MNTARVLLKIDIGYYSKEWKENVRAGKLICTAYLSIIMRILHGQGRHHPSVHKEESTSDYRISVFCSSKTAISNNLTAEYVQFQVENF